MRSRLLALSPLLLLFSNSSAHAEWRYLAPGAGDQNVHRAFAFADKSDDRLEFACNTKRRDLFYSAAQTVSGPELKKLQGGKPAVLVRLDGVGVVPFDAGRTYQQNGRLIFVTAVKPAFIIDLAKASKPIVAGTRADGKIVRQGQFPIAGLQAAMKRLAAGCGF